MTFNTDIKPQAKFENLVTQELVKELLIYNLQTNKAYSLNEITTLVWQNCDGNNDVTQIAKTLEKKLNQSVPDELVWLALDSLRKEGLVSANDTEFPRFTISNRREIIKRIGLASVIALPVISTLVAPIATKAASGSGAGVGETCQSQSPNDSNCLSVAWVCDGGTFPAEANCNSNAPCNAGGGPKCCYCKTNAPQNQTNCVCQNL